MRKLRLNSMTAGLSIGIALAVAIACGLSAYGYSVRHFRAILDSARTTALAQGELIRAALEHQMMENDRSLIAKMVRSFGAEPGVDAVLLLNREGEIKFSSSPALADSAFAFHSPTCQACHQYPPEQRGTSRVIETPGGSVLRSVVPMRNREACFGCHDPSHKTNGILIVDLDVGQMRAAMNRDLRWMAAGSASVMLLLIAAIGLVFRLVVMRRLHRFETTARLIAAGDLDRRVPEDGSDTVAWLAREFNTMADSTTGLLREVRDQRERLETVINSIDDAIVVLDDQRNIIAANDAFLRRTGRGRTDLLGSCCQHVASGMCGPGSCPTQDCLATGERQVRICERQITAGEVAVEEVHSSPIRDPSGKVVHVVEVWRDISKRRAAEARLAESHRLASLGLLASGFSHELNTPLATILACVEGILRSTQPAGEPAPNVPDRIVDNARIARDQLLRCRGITQHFLHLSSGRASPIEILDVAVAVDSAVRLIAPTARARAVSIEVQPVPEEIRVKMNDADLQHVLLNLLLNGVQACGEGGTIRVCVEGGSSVRIRISDDGCGIAPEDLKRIFEPFCSLRAGGTGLGLFLSLDLLRRWGGDLSVHSTPGVGSTFEVVLPPASTGAIRGEATS